VKVYNIEIKITVFKFVFPELISDALGSFFSFYSQCFFYLRNTNNVSGF
jgi:hypothetical protein